MPTPQGQRNPDEQTHRKNQSGEGDKDSNHHNSKDYGNDCGDEWENDSNIKVFQRIDVFDRAVKQVAIGEIREAPRGSQSKHVIEPHSPTNH